MAIIKHYGFKLHDCRTILLFVANDFLPEKIAQIHNSADNNCIFVVANEWFDTRKQVEGPCPPTAITGRRFGASDRYGRDRQQDFCC